MTTLETNLWLIRHAPVDGPRGVIHAPDAPADLGDSAAFAALKARLPENAFAVCSPARRTRETAASLGLDAVENAKRITELCESHGLAREASKEEMLDNPVVVKDNALAGTSAWANTFLGRDHTARDGES